MHPSSGNRRGGSALRLSRIGARFTARTGILELMDELGAALAGRSDLRMLGGGNPARIPAVEAVWCRRMTELFAEGDAFERMLAHYDAPNGQPEFIEALVRALRRRFGWKLTSEHVAVTNGSQNAFFYLFNLLAGEGADGRHRRILLPMTPEYIGYADVGVGGNLFVAGQPRVELRGRHDFKYHIRFDSLPLDEDIAAIALSRPSNPSGNVVSDSELRRLAALAGEREIPLIVDGAYGLPFPDIIFSDAQPLWNRNVILALSLSKLGLPGVRTGIVVADPRWIRLISAFNAVAGLATGNLGQRLIGPLLESGELFEISRRYIRPFYEQRARQARQWIAECLPDDLDYRVHAAEGALFLWLWFPGLPISSAELYRRLKARGVLVVPGHHFAYGQAANEAHCRECIRVTYAQSESVVLDGMRRIGAELRRIYRRRPVRRTRGDSNRRRDADSGRRGARG